MAKLKLTLLQLCKLAEEVKNGCDEMNLNDSERQGCYMGAEKFVRAIAGRGCPTNLSGAGKRERRRSRR